MGYKVPPYRPKHNNGFSLLEILISLVIVTILVALAYPVYQSHIYKVRRIDGERALLNFAVTLEKTAILSGEGFQKDSFTTISPDGYYNIYVVKADQSHFVIAASPLKSQQSDPCGTLAIDDLGRKGRLEGNQIIVDKSCW